jgi:hypothetical protein
MKKNLPWLDAQEQLKAENEFLKMKLMLENGAEFSGNHAGEVPPEIENQFLKNIVEFESQFADHCTIRVFDRIGKPWHFREPSKISDDEMDNAWNELSEWMNEYGVMLDVCNPNVSKRELYRFAVEELFEYEMEDIRIPGMMHGFIYDEFHPDPVYDNSQKAINYCIREIFNPEKSRLASFYKESNLRLNEHYPLTIEELNFKINRFKSTYDELELLELTESGCTKTGTAMVVTGTYLVHAGSDKEKFSLSGSWQVDFEQTPATDEWLIHRVQIEGVKF